MKIVVKQNYGKLFAMLTELGKNGAKSAVRASIRRTAQGVRTAASKDIRSRRLINLSAKAFKSRVRIQDHTRGGISIRDMFAAIQISGKGENLARFYAKSVAAGRSNSVMKQTKYGGWEGVRLYTVKVNEWAQSYLAPYANRAFIIQKGQGAGKIILARLGAQRLPVTKLKGPSVSEVVEKSGELQTLEKVASSRYSKELEHNIEYFAARAVEKGRSGK